MADESYDAASNVIQLMKSTTLSELLGEGAFGWVYKCQHQSDSSWCAVKFIVPKKSVDIFASTTQTTTEDSESHEVERSDKRQREFENLVKKRHKNILQVKEYTERNLGLDEIASFFQGLGNSPALVDMKQRCLLIAASFGSCEIHRLDMELCGRNLKQWLAEDGLEMEPNLLKMQLAIINGLINGVKYLHGEGMMHRDLKPENICFTASESMAYPLPVKITDFGLSREVGAAGEGSESVTEYNLTTQVGTANYQAPEVKSGGDYSFQADLFSLGLIIWEVAQLIKQSNKGSLFTALSLCNTDVVLEHDRIPGIKKLILNLTKVKVEDRVGSINDVDFLAMDPSQSQICAQNSEELQMLLECHDNIVLAQDTEFEGSFIVNRDNVGIQGSPEGGSVLKCRNPVGLEVSGKKCTLSNFTIDMKHQMSSNSHVPSVDGRSLGVLVAGGCNSFTNICVVGGYHGFLLIHRASGNTFSQINIHGAYIGIEIDTQSAPKAEGNIFKDIIMTEMFFSGFQINERHTKIVNFQFSPVGIKQTRRGDRLYLGLETLLLSCNVQIKHSSCGAVKLEGLFHKLGNVNCGESIELRGSGGHTIVNCRGRLYLTDAVGLLESTRRLFPNYFEIYSKGLELSQKLSCAKSGDVIELEEGVYVGGLVLRNNHVHIRGRGDATVLLCDLQNSTVGIHILGNNCSISNCSIVARYGPGVGIHIIGYNNTVKDVTFVKEMTNMRSAFCAETNCISNPPTRPITSEGFRNPWTGVHLAGNGNNVRNIRYNQASLDGDTNIGVSFSGTGNAIDNLICTGGGSGGTGDSYGIFCYPSSSSTLISNISCDRIKLDGNDQTLVYAAATQSIEIEEGNGNILVNCSSNLLWCLDLANITLDCCSFNFTQNLEHQSTGESLISQSALESPTNQTATTKTVCNSEELVNALENVFPGDVIQLREGSYEGQFSLLRNSVTLQGAGTKTILKTEENVAPYGMILIVGGNNCTIRDMAFVVVGDSIGLYLHGTSNTVTNVSVLGGTSGISVLGEDNYLNRLTIENSHRSGLLLGGCRTRVEHVTIRSLDLGIFIDKGSHNDIKGVDCFNVKTGIEVQGDHNSMSGITFKKGSCGSSAIAVDIVSGDGNILTDLKCEGLLRWKHDLGLKIRHSALNSKISQSVCERSAVDGVRNHLSGVDCGILLKVGGSGNTFEKCKADKVVKPGVVEMHLKDCVVMEDGRLESCSGLE